jgi:quercetin dioxygenase-like cupin family protein
MHKTNTVDYAVVYDGEMWLELDDGETRHLNPGDVVVQTVRATHGEIKAASPSPCFFP